MAHEEEPSKVADFRSPNNSMKRDSGSSYCGSGLTAALWLNRKHTQWLINILDFRNMGAKWGRGIKTLLIWGGKEEHLQSDIVAGATIVANPYTLNEGSPVSTLAMSLWDRGQDTCVDFSPVWPVHRPVSDNMIFSTHLHWSTSELLLWAVATPSASEDVPVPSIAREAETLQTFEIWSLWASSVGPTDFWTL